MSNQNPSPPNVIVILTDDQGYWALGCAGNTEIRTPNLDRLAASGMRFENYFCVSPVCSPARASLLTGRIPSQHGVHDWIRAGNSTCEPERGGRLIPYLAGQTAYTDLLAAHGYTCGISGKWHLGDAHHPQKHFSFWRVHARAGGDYYNAPMVKNEVDITFEPDYCTDVFTDNALTFLEAQKDNAAPFYLSVHYTAPHRPWGRDQHPASYFDAYYEQCPFASVPDEPQHPDFANPVDFFTSPEARRVSLSGYYAAVEAMDANVGRILDWLEQKGLTENTLIFFTSDNGMNMGHHGICGKGNGTEPLNMFDTSVKVPAIISHPGHIPAGVVCDALYSHYDFMPTLLDYLNIPNPERKKLPGRSFADTLRGGEAAGQEEVVVFSPTRSDLALAEYGPTRMIRDKQWKYIHRYPDGPHELYDLVSDPGETHNLYGRTAFNARVEELRARLRDWFATYVIDDLDGAHLPVRGRGQYQRASDGPEAFAQEWVGPRDWWGDFEVPKGE